MPRTYKILIPLRVFLAVMMIITLIPIVTLCFFMRWQKFRAALTLLFFKITLLIFSIKVTIKGELSRTRPLLLVANHCSYIDTFVLGAMMPVSFTPKREVRSWPLIGFMCMLADCVFVERRRGHMQEAREAMARRIRQNRILCIFPEGTTSDGKNLLPFKSGFFSLAEEFNLTVQPVTMLYTKLSGKPLPDSLRHHVAWIGADSFFGHFLRIMSYSSISLEVILHPPQTMHAHADRKALSNHCAQIIASAL